MATCRVEPAVVGCSPPILPRSPRDHGQQGGARKLLMRRSPATSVGRAGGDANESDQSSSGSWGACDARRRVRFDLGLSTYHATELENWDTVAAGGTANLDTADLQALAAQFVCP